MDENRVVTQQLGWYNLPTRPYMSGKEALHVISDFDGTWTFETGKKYEDAYVDLLAERLDIPPEEFLPRIIDARVETLAHPEKYGWEVDGRVVAPATSDRFLIMSNATQLVIAGLRREPNHPIFLDTLIVHQLTDEIFTACYPLAESVFKENARELLFEMHKSGKFVIVTNSKTEHVEERLTKLMGPDNGIRVVGGAQKSMVGSDTPRMEIPGLPRQVFLDRPYYLGILRELLDESRGVVMGDVGELDLFAPLWIGLGGVLVTSPQTPPWEIKYVNEHERGRVANSLEEVAGNIRSIAESL